MCNFAIEMPDLALNTSSSGDIQILPVLCIGGKSSRMGSRKELLPFPDGLLSFEHALITIHDAIPTAENICISLHDESQIEGIKFRLRASAHLSVQGLGMGAGTTDEHHHSFDFPALEPIFDLDDSTDIGPAAGLLATHAMHPSATLLVLGCDYPLLSAAALQQLILEYEPPLTCFVNEDGYTEPLIAIWSPEALDTLDAEVKEGRSGLNTVFSMLNGKKVKPLRYIWVTKCNTEEESELARKMLQD